MSGVPETLPSDIGSKLLAIHDALDRIGVRHAFGGAIALDYAIAEPRATRDIDINIAAPVEDAERILAALPSGIAARADVIERIRQEGQDRLRWGDVPVDVFFPQHPYHQVVASRTLPQLFRGATIEVLNPTDLTVFKAMFNRDKDWPDIRGMLEAGAVDEAEALRWLRSLLGTDHPSYLRLAELASAVREQPSRRDERADGDPNVWRQLRKPPE